MRALSTVLLLISVAACGGSGVESTLASGSHEYRTLAYVGERPPPIGFESGEVPALIRNTLADQVTREMRRLGYMSDTTIETADLHLYMGIGATEDGEEGVLVFNVFERESGDHVWQGELRGGPGFDETSLRQGLHEAFETFPPATP